MTRKQHMQWDITSETRLQEDILVAISYLSLVGSDGSQLPSYELPMERLTC